MSRRSVKAGLARKRMQAEQREQRLLAALARVERRPMWPIRLEPCDAVPGIVCEVVYAGEAKP